ncbi:hypothetical protein CMT57_09245 [Elizabethkingia anophelis]|nr:hypothetical protein [Elizabethkingia anophelis]
MKRLEEITRKWSVKFFFSEQIPVELTDEFQKEIEQYAREVAQASLEKAAENAKMKYYNGHDQVDKVVKLVMIGADNVNIDKESIINEQNITLL